MRFIAYGCSYTQGAELADDWLTGKNHLTVDKEKQKTSVDKFYRKYTRDMPDGINNSEYVKIMNERSYAGEIARTLGVTDYVNRAMSGNTNKSMFLDVVKDVQSGFIKQDDIIFVGLTSSDRYTWFKNGRTHFGLASGGSWPNPKVKNAILSSWTDDDFSYDTILATRALCDLLKEYKFFYQTTHFPFSQLPYKTNLTKSILTELEDIDRDAILPNESLWTEIADNKNLPDPSSHGYSHPKIEVASAFGQKVGFALKSKLGNR